MNKRQRRQRQSSVARMWAEQNSLTKALIIFILLSLLLHLLTIGTLFRVRRTVSHQLDISADQLSQVRQQAVQYDFPIDQTIALDTTIAISEVVTVPLTISVPIKQTIMLPVDTPAGKLKFPVPLDFTVPVSDTVEVPIRKDLPIRAEIPINTDIPLELDLNDSPIGDILKYLEDKLRELRYTLNE